MKKIILLITLIALFVLSTSCANKSTNTTNNAVILDDLSRETRPSPPSGPYKEGEADELYERLCYRVESELQNHVNYNAYDMENVEKNIVFLLENYKKLELDILDSAEYITDRSDEYEDDIDDKVHDKVFQFMIDNEKSMNELTRQAKIGFGVIPAPSATSSS
jgi:hypothetical protein